MTFDMHIFIATLIGLFVLAIFLVLHKHQRKTPAQGAMAFCGFWLVATIVHYCVGVYSAGYHASEEFAVHTIIFGLPALAALVIAKTSRPAIAQ